MNKIKNILLIIGGILLLSCIFLVLWDRHRLSAYESKLNELEAKLTQIETEKQLLDSTRVITMNDLSENAKVIDSLQQVMENRKTDTLTINEALNLLEQFSK